MDTAILSEADRRYLERIAADCAELLGPGVELDDLDTVDSGPHGEVIIELRYRLGDVAWSSEGRGSTVIEAHGDLRQHLVIDRLRMATAAVFRASR
jgi:hypothetical protein